MPDLIPVDHDPFNDPPSNLVPVDHDPFAPVAKAGQTVQKSDVLGQQRNIQQAVTSAISNGLGITDAYRAATGQMTPDEAQTFALGALPLALAPEARMAGTAADLGMDALSRLGRAQQMGFRTAMPLYHGSGESFSAFRAVPTTAEDMTTPGVSVALDPDVANEFAQGNAQANPQIYPLLHRADNPAVLNLTGDETHGEVVGTLRDAFDSGHDAVMLKNYTTPGGKTGKNIIIVRDANQLRSPHAAFDKAKKFSPELLAGIGGMMAIPAAGIAVPVEYDPFAAH